VSSLASDMTAGSAWQAISSVITEDDGARGKGM
jgi:hypothetical protein